MKIDDKRMEVLKTLLDRPGKEWSVSELADTAGISQPTVSRIVEEFEEEGIVSSERKGNMKLVGLERKDYVEEVVEAISGRHRLMQDAAETFAEKISVMDRVVKVVLFGSVARGTADFDSDIDVLIIVSGPVEEIRERVMVKAESVSEESGFHISPTVMNSETYREHEEEESQFYRSVEQDEVVLYDEQAP